MLDITEYSAKLDSYYFDKKLNTTIVVLKIRNKRTIYNLSIKELLSNKLALSTLHPIDLCIIGVLANSETSDLKSKNSKRISLVDDYLMVRIEPLLEIIGRNYVGDDEQIILKLKPLNKIIKTTAKELYNNKKLLNALKYQDALSLGYSLSESSQFLPKSVIRSQNHYSGVFCIINGLFLGWFILSVILLGKLVTFYLFNYKFELRGETLLAPLLFLLQNLILEKFSIKDSNKLLLSIIFVLIIFLLYFHYIVSLSYPTNNPTTMAFGILNEAIINRPPTYVLGFIAASLANIYTRKTIKQYLINFSRFFQRTLLTYYQVSLFFLTLALFSIFFNTDRYKWMNYIYSLALITCFSLIELGLAQIITLSKLAVGKKKKFV